MKKYILPFIALLLAPCSTIWAQSYVVTSLATPGAATFQSDKIVDGVINVPFTASTQAIEVETNQTPIFESDADWCRASFADGVLTVSVDENPSSDARTAILTIHSKDIHAENITVKQESRLAFAVISDTHIGNRFGGRDEEKVSRALQNLTGKGKLDAIAVVGDLTDGGTAQQYVDFDSIFNDPDNILNPVDKFLFMMGNHDNYNDSDQKNYKTGLRNFNIKNGRPTNYPLHQYTLIKGYPFITISVLSGANNDNSSNDGFSSYPTSSMSTLTSYMNQARKDAPGKPIFIFAHVAPRRTCYSTWEEEGAVWAMWRLNNTLRNNYPEAVVFCGHSHYPLGDPRSIHQGANPNSKNYNYYTVINTASTTYSEINPNVVEGESNGIHPEGFKNVTEGMIVRELANGDIEIVRYDTYRDVEIDPDHRWVIKAPFDGSMFQYADIRDENDNPDNVPLRNGLPAPRFDSESNLYLDDISSSEVTLRFDQATDEECVFRYQVTLYNSDHTVFKAASVFSQFYLTTDMPQQLSYEFTGLTPGTEYIAEVIAYDSWGNASMPMSCSCSIPAEDAPVPDPVGWWTFDNPNDLFASTSGVATLQGAFHDYGLVETPDFEELNIEAVEGPSAENGAVSVPAHNSLFMTTNLNTDNLSSYSFLMDIQVEKFNGIYTALYQNDLTNTKDASLFINKNGQVGKGSNLGYHGLISNTGWHRVIFVVKKNKAKIYIDGTFVGESASADETNWQMNLGALFFADNDDNDGTEENVVKAAELRFWDRAITAGQAAQLGTVPGLGGPADVTIPDALGVWTFDDASNPYAGTGTATLVEVEHATDGSGGVRILPDGYAAKPVEGPAEGNGAVRVPVGTSMYMASNLDVTEMTTYSIMWDVKAEDISSYIPLLQNDTQNQKDGSLFLNKNMVGLNSSGLGYHGTILNDKWYRILFVVENSYGRVFVDGEMVGESTQPCDQHWKLTADALFFADNDGEEKEIQTAEIRFWNVALDFAQAAKLGAAGTSDTPGPGPEPTFPTAKGIWTFDNAQDLMAGTGIATLQGATHEKNNVNVVNEPDNANIAPADGPQEGNGAAFVPVGSSLMMTTNLTETSLSSFTFMMDIKLDAIGSFMPIFQNDLNNSRDACLFIGQNGTIGIRLSGLNYSTKTITAGQWHRLVAVSKDAKMTVYLDGEKVVGESPNANTERWQIGTGVLFFADEDGEETDIRTAEIRFWDTSLTDSQVAELGTAGSDFVPPTPPDPIDPDAVPAEYCSWTFDDSSDPLTKTGGTGASQLHAVVYDNEQGTMEVVSLRNAHISSYTDPYINNGILYVPVGSGLMMAPSISNTSTYSLLMDFKMDDVSGFASLFQNDLTNKKDASLFVNEGEVGLNNAGLGYNGTINAGQWHRLVFVARENFATVYVDGQMVVHSLDANEQHWYMKNGLIFFADQDGEEKPAYISELRFWNQELTAEQVFKLGTAHGGEAQPVAVPETSGAWTFDNPNNPYAGTGTASITGYKKVGIATMTGPLEAIVSENGPSEGNGAVKVPVGYGIQMSTNLDATTLDSYTFSMDICLDDVDGFAALFQNDNDNNKDASLFVKNGQVGINVASLGYSGTINAGQWHRVVFVCNRLFAYVYIDGVKVGRSTSANAESWQMGKKAVFFVDENEDQSEEKEIKIADLRFWDKVLTESEIQQLGNVWQ